MEPSGGAQGRPYRSHSHPACLPCRRRKSRCRTKDIAENCISCQVHGTECVFPQAVSSQSPRRHVRAKRVKRNTPRRDRKDQIPSRPTPLRQFHLGHPERHYPDDEERSDAPSNCGGMFAEAGDNGSHIVSPAIVDDSEMLESYLTTTAETHGRRLIRAFPPANASGRTVRPVLFSTLPKRSSGGVGSHQSRASEKYELIEKLIEPHAKDLVDLFFEKTNICFPIFDESSFKKTYASNRRKVSLALLSNLYASALIYWPNSPKSRFSRRPDLNFVWVQAYEALSSEVFLCPGTSTVIAIMLNVSGRPSISIIANEGLLGLAISLSNAMGLNRDPSNWNISRLEKQIRIKIWWLVVVHDRCLAYGIPLQIHRAQHDVPIPSTQDLSTPDASPAQVTATAIFIALISLTEVLGRYLEYVYQLTKDSQETPETSTTDLELLLGEWEETLSSDVRRVVIRGTDLSAPGAANLRLSYLAVKLLLRRIQLDLDRGMLQTEDESFNAPLYLRAQRAAEEIVHFVQELNEPHFRGFWIPAHAFALTSATSFLLRSALRSSKNATGDNTPLKLARDMIDTLRRHSEEHSWDLADNCLANCSEMLEKIEAGMRDYSSSSPPLLSNFEEYPDIDVSVLDDLLTGFRYPFEMEE
ncbi:hypothetical protein FQN51_001646 [Onygenales sp. PD_10]|nr:hypothetical protein FQN51_001646 [Onygenales sp. PD_10]